VLVVYLPWRQRDPSGQLSVINPIATIMKDCPQMTVLPHVHRTNEESSDSSTYPINVMRNEGLDDVTTLHVLIIDVDLIPFSYAL